MYLDFNTLYREDTRNAKFRKECKKDFCIPLRGLACFAPPRRGLSLQVMRTLCIAIFLLFFCFQSNSQTISDSAAIENSNRPSTDQVFPQDYEARIIELNKKYEAAQLEKKLLQQQNRIRVQNILFIAIGGLILLGGLLVYSQYRRSKLNQESNMKTELIRQQELAVKAVIEAEENERQRIARELHDGIGQMMSAAKMNLSAFESEVTLANEEQKKSLEKVIQLVDESCKEIRTVSHIMMPNALLKNNLASAIRDFVNKLNTKAITANVFTDGLDSRLDASVETVLYRVVQECVHNAIRHAGATRLDISLTRDKEGISGTVEDNGKGFDAVNREKYDGIGLRNIITRIGYLKGTVDFDSSPGKGTLVAFHIPL